MRRRLFWIFLITSVLFVSLVALFAQDNTTDTIYGLVTVDTADVRVGPDFAYAVIGQLPRDASVVVLGRAGDFFARWDGRQWVKIDYGNSPAWIYARLLRTSIAFNSIPPTGRLLPRDANGRVPDGFDLNSDVCSQWHGDFTLSGNYMAGDNKLIVTYPTLQGANVYSVIVIAPNGDRRAVPPCCAQFCRALRCSAVCRAVLACRAQFCRARAVLKLLAASSQLPAARLPVGARSLCRASRPSLEKAASSASSYRHNTHD